MTDLKAEDIIAYEKRLYFKDDKEYFKNKVICSYDYLIFRYLFYLRKTEKYQDKYKLADRILFLVNKRKKNKIGLKLGFQIPEGCFGKGLKIYHASNIVVNSAARIGQDCEIVGNVCIGSSGGGKAPQLGKNVHIGWGASVIGDVLVPDNAVIGAGAVVIRSSFGDSVKLVGVPAKEIKK